MGNVSSSKIQAGYRVTESLEYPGVYGQTIVRSLFSKSEGRGSQPTPDRTATIDQAVGSGFSVDFTAIDELDGEGSWLNQQMLAVFLQAPSTNTTPVYATEGSSAGYPFAGGNAMEVKPGQTRLFRFGDASNIGASTKTIDFTGATSADTVKIVFLSGVGTTVTVRAFVPASNNIRGMTVGSIDSFTDDDEKERTTIVSQWTVPIGGSYDWMYDAVEDIRLGRDNSGGATAAKDRYDAACDEIIAVNPLANLCVYWGARNARTTAQVIALAKWPVQGAIYDHADDYNSTMTQDVTNDLLEEWAYAPGYTVGKWINHTTANGRAKFRQIVLDYIDNGPFSTMSEFHGMHFDQVSGTGPDGTYDLTGAQWNGMYATFSQLKQDFEARGLILSINVGGWGPQNSTNPSWAPTFFSDLKDMCHTLRWERTPYVANSTGYSAAGMKNQIDNIRQHIFEQGLQLELLHGSQNADHKTYVITAVVDDDDISETVFPGSASYGQTSDPKVILAVTPDPDSAEHIGMSWGGAAALGTTTNAAGAVGSSPTGYAPYPRTGWSLHRDDDSSLANNYVILFNQTQNSNDMETTIQATDSNFTWEKLAGGVSVNISSVAGSTGGGTTGNLELTVASHAFYKGQPVTITGVDSIYDIDCYIVDYDATTIEVNIAWNNAVTPSLSTPMITSRGETVSHYDWYPILQAAIGLMACNSMADAWNVHLSPGSAANPWDYEDGGATNRDWTMWPALLGEPLSDPVYSGNDSDGYALPITRDFANGYTVTLDVKKRTVDISVT